MRNQLIISSFLSALLFMNCCSCGSTERSSAPEVSGGEGKVTEEEFLDACLSGETAETDYIGLLSAADFAEQSGFELFVSPDDPLKLSEDTDENAYLVRPYKIAVVSGQGEVTPMNIWEFPVAANGKYIGNIAADCRKQVSDKIIYTSSGGLGPAIGRMAERGTFAVFYGISDDDSLYAIYEDGTVVNIQGNTPYSGTLTYEEIAQEYNVITPDRINERVYPDNGELPEGTDADWEATPEENIASALSGSQEEYSYEEITSDSGFQVCYAQFTMEENPLHLKNGTSADAAVIRPFKIAVADDEGIAGVMNVWEYLIASGDTYLGVISADCRYGENGPEYTDFTAYQFIADKLNEALESGDIAIFYDGTENYGIYEDGTVINLTGTAPYTGTLTFEEADKGVNLITAGRINEKLDIDPSGIVQVSNE